MFDCQVSAQTLLGPGAAVLWTTEAAVADRFMGYPLWSVVHRTRRLPVDPLKPEPETSQPLGLEDPIPASTGKKSFSANQKCTPAH
ncbi:hypothetical protein OJAV_G00106180 [Oryzias javanicus]|uniref:Uncharacterized protein n=1 Tax=Oryzias javanicus TaxID=123683 RepID=A0A437CU75_ORYJA|nr:hypothetical protein OJAV_G00106180 [Oryzias javanicus]